MGPNASALTEMGVPGSGLLVPTPTTGTNQHLRTSRDSSCANTPGPSLPGHEGLFQVCAAKHVRTTWFVQRRGRERCKLLRRRRTAPHTCGKAMDGLGTSVMTACASSFSAPACDGDHRASKGRQALCVLQNTRRSSSKAQHTHRLCRS